MFDKTKERIAAAKAIPDQIKGIATLAITALLIALIALSMSVVRYAN